MSGGEEQTERIPERAGCVVGISLGLLLIVALISSLFGVRGQVLEPAEVLGEHFSYAEWPFELGLVSAAALPGGDRVVRLAHPDYAEPEPEPEPELEPEPEEEKLAETTDQDESESTGDVEGEGSRRDMGAGFGWSPPEVEMLEGNPPTELFFIFSGSPAASVRAFRGKSQDGFEGDGRRGRGSRGGGREGEGREGSGGFGEHPITMDGGDLDWGRARVGFRHERRFKGQSAFDEVRVNLSTTGRYCILVIRWPENQAGSKERVEELLAGLSAIDS